MVTFPDPRVTKELLVADMIAHAEADELVRGTYGEDHPAFRGCAVGCSIHTINRVTGRAIPYGDHAALADATGISFALIHLQDRVFEGLPVELSDDWPRRFYAAVPKNVDLSPAVDRVLVRILRKIALPCVTVDEWGVRAVIEMVVTAIKTGVGLRAAANASVDAAYAAYAAASDAADAADAAGDAADAADAAYAAAAYTASYAAKAAFYAAKAAADSTTNAADASYAAYAASYAADATADAADDDSAAYTRMGEIICEEMAACTSAVDA